MSFRLHSALSVIPLRAVTILLLFVILVLVVSFPQALSQSFTTVTNVLTTTGFWTSTSYSTSTVGTATSTVAVNNTFLATMDNLQKPANSGGCWFDSWNITVEPGTTEITGTIGPPSAKIDFFILSPSEFNAFRMQPESCGNAVNTVVTAYGVTTTYTLDWKNPAPGWYYFIFLSESTGGMAYTITTPFTLVATYNQAETSTVYNVITIEQTLSVAQNLTSIQVLQVLMSTPTTSTTPALNPTLIAAVIIVIVAILGTLFFIKSKRGKSTAV